METFKGTPTFIEWKRSYHNVKFDNTIHTFNISVERENGMIDDGIFTTTKENQTKFKVGEKVEMKTSAVTEDHELTTKFDKVSQKGSGTGGSGSSKDSVKDRSIVANVSILCATRMVVNKGKVDAITNDLTGILTLANKVYEYIMEKGAGNTQKSITIQAQVKIVTEYFHNFPNVTLDTSNNVLEAADKLIAWVENKAKG